MKLNYKKNPNIKNFITEIPAGVDFSVKILNEQSIEGEIYLIELDKSTHISGEFLISGQYILKIFKKSLNEQNIDYLNILSNLKLIPEIYLINYDYILMKYIECITLNDFLNKKQINTTKIRIFTLIENMIENWHGRLFAHGDLTSRNILITKNNKILFIDPVLIDDRSIGKYNNLFKEDNFRLFRIKKMLEI